MKLIPYIVICVVFIVVVTKVDLFIEKKEYKRINTNIVVNPPCAMCVHSRNEMFSVVHLTISIQSFNAIHGHVCKLEKKTSWRRRWRQKKRRNFFFINFVEVARRVHWWEEKKNFLFSVWTKQTERIMGFLSEYYFFLFSPLSRSFSSTLLAFLCQLGHIMSHCYGANVMLTYVYQLYKPTVYTCVHRYKRIW